ncbi:(4Fe-4S)-binding protein [Candidatus Thorarchaeota archaeon]|nr:MAG: (4Fe-4S)-binding protein [Candidatus Thorarchaeota archaeon]
MVSEIAIISGKGGTGKTTVAASLIALSGKTVMADCDVDAPDLHILLKPDVKQESEFSSSKIAEIDPELCIECGLCEEKCRFDAAHPPEIYPIACEGCAVCELVCPEKAISMRDRISGFLYESNTRYGPMAHAKLLAGEGNSGKLVTEVRSLGVNLAKSNNSDVVIIDGSPGVGCPVIATVTGIQLGVIVTEPTLSGIHDMNRVVQLLQRFEIPGLLIVNKYDLSRENTERIEQYAKENEVDVIAKIPFDPIMTRSMIALETMPEHAPSHEITGILRDAYRVIMDRIEK